jgi:hypothetical protein
MEISEKKDFKAFLFFGAIMGLVAVLGALSDIGLSSILGGPISAPCPRTLSGDSPRFTRIPSWDCISWIC